jgi:hypothetical protein
MKQTLIKAEVNNIIYIDNATDAEKETKISTFARTLISKLYFSIERKL